MTARVAATAMVVVVAACGDAEPPAGESCQVEARANPSAIAAVDVILVVDESADMAEHQAALATNLERFALVLESIEGGMPSVRVAVVSADSERGGAFEGPPDGAACAGATSAVIEDSREHWWTCSDDQAARCGARNYDGDFGDVLACAGTRGAAGTGSRAPLDALRRALSPDNPDRGALLRDDAMLAVYIIAAGDDASIDNVARYADDVRAAVADVEQIVVGVVGDGPGPRLSAFAGQFPGRNTVVDIRGEDWSEVMSMLASLHARTLGFTCLPATTVAGDCIAAEDRALQELIPRCDMLTDARPDPATALPCFWIEAVDDPGCPLRPFVERPDFDLHMPELRCAAACQLAKTPHQTPQ